jgi:hypothetical protein
MLMRNWLLCLNHNDGYYFASWWMMNNLNSVKKMICEVFLGSHR